MQKKAPQFILQLTDTHILPQGTLLSGQVDTGAIFLRALKRINTLSVKPQAVVITGDLVDDGSVESYIHLKNMLNMIDVPVHVMVGNHDDRTHLKEVFPELELCPSLAHTNFIQYAVDVGGVRLVALDTLVPGQNYGALCDVRLQWLADTLAQAPDMPTIVAMHHPPFETGMVFMDQLRLLEGVEGLAKIISSNKQVLRVICGHQHRGCVQVFAGTVGIVAPSASHQLDLQLQPSDPLAYTCELPVGEIHLWQEGGSAMTSHLVCLDNSTSHPVLLDSF